MADQKQGIMVKIHARSGSLFSGQVKHIAARNKTGSFDILPLHENFITLLTDSLTLTLVSGEKKEFQVENAILRVVENEVNVYIGVREAKS